MTDSVRDMEWSKATRDEIDYNSLSTIIIH